MITPRAPIGGSSPVLARLRRNTVLNALGHAAPLAAATLALPVIVRLLGTERFGLLSLALVALGHLLVFDLGLGRATTKLVAERLARGANDEVRAVVWTAAALQAGVGVVGMAIVVWAAPLLAELVNVPGPLRWEAELTVYGLAVAIPLVSVATSLRGFLEGLQRFDLVNLIGGPTGAAVFVGLMLGSGLGLTVPGLVVVLVAVKLLELLALVVTSMLVFPGIRRPAYTDGALVRQILAFGGWLTLSAVVAPILVYVDRFLIGTYWSMTMVSYYTAPHEIVTRLWILPASLVLALFPIVAGLGDRPAPAELPRLVATSMKWLLFTVAPLALGLVLFAEKLLDAWLGPEFAQHGTDAVRLLAIGVLVNSLAQVPYAVLLAKGRSDIPAKFHVLELPIYAVLAWWWIRDMAIVGAALAWLVRITLDAVLLFAAAVRICGPWRPWLGGRAALAGLATPEVARPKSLQR